MNTSIVTEESRLGCCVAYMVEGFGRLIECQAKLEWLWFATDATEALAWCCYAHPPEFRLTIS
jgi:hypothetical protein